MFLIKVRSTNIDNGLTLIEILVAIVVFSMALLGVAQIMVSTISINIFSDKLTTSTILVQDKLEDIHRLGYVNADTAVGVENYNTISDFESYKRVTSVNNDVPATGMKTVEITVFWNNDVGSTSINTILSE